MKSVPRFCFLFLPLLCVNGVPCQLQEPDAVALCPMCSQSNAAVRWTVIPKDFDFFFLAYACYYPNDTIIYEEDSDFCFNETPISSPTSPRRGVSSIGHELNTAGIRCTFRSAYRLKSSGLSATVPNVECTIQSPEVCAANPDECHVDRVSIMNEDGQCPDYQCAEGYTGYLCNNIDECATSHGCSSNASCIDTDGSYLCECLSGFKGDGYNCADINECLNETCSNVNAECVNNAGSFSCQCKQGYTGDGDNCTDINECETRLSNGCSENAYCHNTNGSYWCECKPGFKGNGHECLDINECDAVMCSNEFADCINTVGNYSCQCMEGYTGDGHNCTDVDECFKGSYSCPNNTNCTNMLGGYECIEDNGIYTTEEAYKSTYNVAGMMSGIILSLFCCYY